MRPVHDDMMSYNAHDATHACATSSLTGAMRMRASHPRGPAVSRARQIPEVPESARRISSALFGGSQHASVASASGDAATRASSAPPPPAESPVASPLSPSANTGAV